jgi:hypothetical protein
LLTESYREFRQLHRGQKFQPMLEEMYSSGMMTGLKAIGENKIADCAKVNVLSNSLLQFYRYIRAYI